MINKKVYTTHNPEGMYFVTLTVVEWVDVFTRNLHMLISAKQGFSLPPEYLNLSKMLLFVFGYFSTNVPHFSERFCPEYHFLGELRGWFGMAFFEHKTQNK